MKCIDIQKTLLAAMITAALMPADATPAHRNAPSNSKAAPTASAENPADVARQNGMSSGPQSSSESDNDKKATNLGSIVVSPILKSLQSAQSIKRDSRMIVDAIVAEDIGKLPDSSVADAMQRITGVQVAQGFQGETTSVRSEERRVGKRRSARVV